MYVCKRARMHLMHVMMYELYAPMYVPKYLCIYVYVCCAFTYRSMHVYIYPCSSVYISIYAHLDKKQKNLRYVTESMYPRISVWM